MLEIGLKELQACADKADKELSSWCFLHKKSSKKVQVCNVGYLESSMELMVVYEEFDSGLMFIRPYSEFTDGRFERVR